jgi:hypothetical protein
VEKGKPLLCREWNPDFRSFGPKYIDISQEYLLNQLTLQIACAYKRTVVRCSVRTDGWGSIHDGGIRTFFCISTPNTSLRPIYHLKQLGIGAGCPATVGSSATEVKRQ